MTLRRAAPAAPPRIHPLRPAGATSGRAAAALLTGIDHVGRHHLSDRSRRSAGVAPLHPMIALNLLRELDTLMRHTIAEASYTRSGATYAPTPAERRGFAAVDAMRVRLAAIEVPASGPPRQGRPGGAAPRPDELHAALAVAVDLCAAVVGHVPADAVDPIPAAALPIAPRRAAIA